jgi:hypothetical protein
MMMSMEPLGTLAEFAILASRDGYTDLFWCFIAIVVWSVIAPLVSIAWAVRLLRLGNRAAILEVLLFAPFAAMSFVCVAFLVAVICGTLSGWHIPRAFSGLGETMLALSEDDLGRLYLAIYCAIGLPIVWLHMRQQNMISSTKKSGNAAGLVIYTLAVMWPILLFAMVLNYFLVTSPRTRKQKPEDRTPEK